MVFTFIFKACTKTTNIFLKTSYIRFVGPQILNHRFTAMGIHGLTKLLADHAPSCMKENEMKNYFGKFKVIKFFDVIPVPLFFTSNLHAIEWWFLFPRVHFGAVAWCLL